MEGMMGATSSRAARAGSWLPAALALCLTGLSQSPCQAEELANADAPIEITECGQVVVTDAVLTADLVCQTRRFAWAAIEIAASDVTVDLGGHTLFGQPVGSLGIRADGFSRVTVKNGTIDGFLVGITFADGHDNTVENVTIRTLENDDPDEFIFGVWLVGAQGTVVKDSVFEYLPVFHRSAVELYGSDCTIDGIEAFAGGCGIDFNFGSTGSAIDSRFVGVVLSGVLVQNAREVLVANNEFAWGGDGVTADPDAEGSIRDLSVYGNYIHDGSGGGVHLRGASDSRVVNNTILNNWQGIVLERHYACPSDQPPPECFYPARNVIADNKVTGNHLDLYHHEYAVGNTWIRNVCDTKEGAEIPECSGEATWRRLKHRLRSSSP